MRTSFPWPLAAVLPPEPERFVGAVSRAAASGYTHLEVAALVDRPSAHLEALADAGVLVPCVRLSGDLSHASVEVRRAMLRQLERQVADAARLGATCAVLESSPGNDPGEEACFTEGCRLLAEYARGRMVHLLVRPDPERAAIWLASVPNVGLALEGEEILRVREAGARALHIRVRGPEPSPALAEALRTINYRGVVSVLVWEGADASGTAR
jgi:sugar phosphate isomerase/epimerase